MRRLRDESGQVAVEFVGMIGWLLLAGLLIWQLLLVTWTFTQASNAARTASRVDARGGDPEKAGKNALDRGLRKGAKVEMSASGERATVRVPIPILLPGLNSEKLRATRSATLPG